MKMQFDQFVFWGFTGLLSFCSVTAVTILGLMYGSLKELAKDVAVIVARVDYHEERISKLETHKES